MSFNIEVMKRRLLIKYPFFGSVLANTNFIETDSEKTAATDGKNIYYNLNFVNSLKEKEQTFLFAHEVCHIAFDHIYRSEGKNQRLWNIATDGVINSILSQNEGLPLIEGVVNIKDANKYDSEELYEKLLKENQQSQSEQQNNSGVGSSQKQNGSGSGKDSQEEEKQQNVGHDNHSIWSEAVKKKNEEDKNKKSENDDEIQKEAKKMSKIGEKKIFEENKIMRDNQLDELRKSLAEQSTTCGSRTNQIKINVGQIGASKALIDWRRYLREAVKYDEDWSFQSPIIEDGIIKPERIDLEKSETEILLDTSGSINDILLRNFLRECKNILKTSNVRVGCFDEKFYGFTNIKTMSDIENLQLEGRGGTDFNVAVNSFSKNATNKIIFTDGCATMPQKKADVIWIVFGGKKINPLGGKVININEDDLYKLERYEENNTFGGKRR